MSLISFVYQVLIPSETVQRALSILTQVSESGQPKKGPRVDHLQPCSLSPHRVSPAVQTPVVREKDKRRPKTNHTDKLESDVEHENTIRTLFGSDTPGFLPFAKELLNWANEQGGNSQVSVAMSTCVSDSPWPLLLSSVPKQNSLQWLRTRLSFYLATVAREEDRDGEDIRAAIEEYASEAKGALLPLALLINNNLYRYTFAMPVVVGVAPTTKGAALFKVYCPPPLVADKIFDALPEMNPRKEMRWKDSHHRYPKSAASIARAYLAAEHEKKHINTDGWVLSSSTISGDKLPYFSAGALSQKKQVKVILIPLSPWIGDHQQNIKAITNLLQPGDGPGTENLGKTLTDLSAHILNKRAKRFKP